MPKMTLNFTLLVQGVALFSQFMMQPSAELFGWKPALVNWLHALISALQAWQGYLAHKHNTDGTKPAEVPSMTMHREEMPSGQVDTTVKVENVSRKQE